MTGQAIVELSDEWLDASVAHGVTLVSVCAPWCAACRVEHEILDEVAEALGDRATVAELNVDKSRLYVRLRIHAIPTLLVFKDGKEVKRLVGVQTGEDVRALLEWYVAHS
jgi:thioredoxin 1